MTNVLFSLVPADLHCDYIYFYFIRKKQTQNQHRLNYDKGLRKFCATCSEYFIHFLMTNSQSSLWRNAANFLDRVLASIHFWLLWCPSTGFSPYVLIVGSISSPVQWITDVYEDLLHFSSLMNMFSANIAAKSLRLAIDRPNIHLALYRGLPVPWSVVVDSRKVFKKLCMYRMFLLPSKSFWLPAIRLWPLERRVISLEAFWSLRILSTDRLVIISLTNLWSCLFFTLMR